MVASIVIQPKKTRETQLLWFHRQKRFSLAGNSFANRNYNDAFLWFLGRDLSLSLVSRNTLLDLDNIPVFFRFESLTDFLTIRMLVVRLELFELFSHYPFRFESVAMAHDVRLYNRPVKFSLVNLTASMSMLFFVQFYSQSTPREPKRCVVPSLVVYVIFVREEFQCDNQCLWRRMTSSFHLPAESAKTSNDWHFSLGDRVSYVRRHGVECKKLL